MVGNISGTPASEKSTTETEPVALPAWPILLAVSFGGLDAAVTDWNLDGIDDVIGNGGIFLRAERQHFCGSVPLVGGTYHGATDLNLDGYPDLIAERAGSTPTRYLSTALSALGEVSCMELAEEGIVLLDSGDFDDNRTVVGELAAFDADGDGDIDIAVANVTDTNIAGYNGNNELYLNDGDGTYTKVAAAAGSIDDSTTRSPALVAFDADGDGDLDLAVVNGAANVANELHLNDGSGGFTLAANPGHFDDTSGTNRTYNDLVAFDVDGDNDLDLIGATSNFSPAEMYLNNGSGVFTLTDAGQLDDNNNDDRAYAVLDADGDGDLDLAVGDYNSSAPNRLYLNNGSGSFTLSAGAGAFGTTNFQTRTLVAFDADGDGDDDLATGRYSSPNALWLNDGSGSFASFDAGEFDNTNHNTEVLVPVDFDQDGDLDLILGNNSRHMIYLNNGDGTFVRGDGGALEDTTLTSAISSDAVAFDADGDGDPDVAFGYYGAGNNVNHRVFYNEGLYESGTLTSGEIKPTTLYSDSGDLISWQYVTVTQDIPEGTSIVYDVLNPTNDTPLPGYEGLTPDASGRISLTGLDPSTVASIKLRAHFSQTDAGSGNDLDDPTPRLCNWRVTFSMEEWPTITFRVRVDDPVATQVLPDIDNTVSITTTTAETNYANNEDDDEILVRLTDVEIIKTVDMAAAAVGNTLTYTLNYAVNGPQDAVNVVLTDELPAGLTYTGASQAPSAINGQTLTWNLGNLAVGSSGTITVTATINAGATAGQTFLNVTKIENDRQETDYTNNEDSALTSDWKPRQCLAT